MNSTFSNKLFSKGQMSLKDSSRANQLDCVINYFFQLYLILYIYVQRFDVMNTIEIILKTKHDLSFGNWDGLMYVESDSGGAAPIEKYMLLYKLKSHDGNKTSNVTTKALFSSQNIFYNTRHIEYSDTYMHGALNTIEKITNFKN